MTQPLNESWKSHHPPPIKYDIFGWTIHPKKLRHYLRFLLIFYCLFLYFSSFGAGRSYFCCRLSQMCANFWPTPYVEIHWTTHPLPKAQNLMTHRSLFRNTSTILFDQSLTILLALQLFRHVFSNYSIGLFKRQIFEFLRANALYILYFLIFCLDERNGTNETRLSYQVWFTELLSLYTELCTPIREVRNAIVVDYNKYSKEKVTPPKIFFCQR